MAITAAQVKDLRAMTGAGPLDCKKALEQNDGDVQKAAEWLRERGIAKASKKLNSGRSTNEGIVEVYKHFNGSMAVIAEVNCETDFVANTESFQQLAKDIVLHIVSMKPQYVNREDVPQELVEAEREVLMRMDDLDGKPDNIKEKITDGRLDKWYKDIVLMEQEFLKDDSKTIQELIKEAVAELGENIQISRFARFELGGDSDDEGADEE